MRYFRKIFSPFIPPTILVLASATERKCRQASATASVSQQIFVDRPLPVGDFKSGEIKTRSPFFNAPCASGNYGTIVFDNAGARLESFIFEQIVEPTEDEDDSQLKLVVAYIANAVRNNECGTSVSCFDMVE